MTINEAKPNRFQSQINPESWVDIPLTPYDVTLGNFIAFTSAYKKIGAVEKPKDESDEAYYKWLDGQQSMMFEAITKIAKISDEDILYMMPYEGIDDLEPITALDTFDTLTLRRICFHCVAMVGTHNPDSQYIVEEKFEITHMGLTYRARFHEHGFGRLMTWQKIELDELNRVLSIAHKKDGDPEGTLEHTRLAMLCAVLLFTEKETIPFSPPMRQEYIARKAHKFENISMGAALDLAFFLTYTIAKLEKINVISTSLKACRPTQPLTTAPTMLRASRRGIRK